MTTQNDTTTKQLTSEVVIDELMTGYETPEDLLGDDGGGATTPVANPPSQAPSA